MHSNLQPNFILFFIHHIVFEQFCVNPHGSHHVDACLSLSAQTICAVNPSDPWRLRSDHSNSYSLQRRFGRNGEKGWSYQLYCKFEICISYLILTNFHLIFLQLNTPTRFDDLNDIIGKDTDPSNSDLHTPVQVREYLRFLIDHN